MNNIIVTGATSMIGVALIEEAVKAGTHVYALTRPNTARIGRLPESDLVHIIDTDLNELETVQIPATCDTLYHFAWAGTAKEQRNNPDINERNIRFTLDAVKLAYRSGCHKFIGAGSQAEYGSVNEEINKDTSFSPEIAYGISKYAAGKLSRIMCEEYGMIHIWGRIFSVYGKNDNSGTMIDYAIKQFKKKEKAFFSSGKQKWNYLHERDAGKMFYAMGNKIEESKYLIVSSNETRELREFIQIIAEIMNTQDLCIFAENDGRTVYGIDPDCKETCSLLEMDRFITFSEGIRELLAGAYK